MDRTISHIICRRFLQMYKFNIVFLFNSHRSMQKKTNLGKMSTTCTDNEFLGGTFTLRKGNRFYLQLQELYLKKLVKQTTVNDMELIILCAIDLYCEKNQSLSRAVFFYIRNIKLIVFLSTNISQLSRLGYNTYFTQN